jgi:hypothetical protein
VLALEEAQLAVDHLFVETGTPLRANSSGRASAEGLLATTSGGGGQVDLDKTKTLKVDSFQSSDRLQKCPDIHLLDYSNRGGGGGGRRAYLSEH